MTIPNTDPAPYEATVLCDSIAADVRLTTMVVKIPRIVLAEFNTHRVLSRNSASSRAIPVKKRIAGVEKEPFVPLTFGKNKRGMQSTKDLEGGDAWKAERIWLDAKADAVKHANALADVGVHKQIANRLIEPFAWQTIIVTATDWANYWALRISEKAQPSIARASLNMKRAMATSVPENLDAHEWHLPLITDEERLELDLELLVKLSCARCARVSYLTHGGVRDIEKDVALYEQLRSNGHMSPFEHAAQVDPSASDFGNFSFPWRQHRKMMKGEAVFTPPSEDTI